MCCVDKINPPPKRNGLQWLPVGRQLLLKNRYTQRGGNYRVIFLLAITHLTEKNDLIIQIILKLCLQLRKQFPCEIHTVNKEILCKIT
jgi:hypothetical protein